MEKEYILSFSSFYKAAYAKDSLQERGIGADLRRLPPQLARSCSTGVYLKGAGFEAAQQVLAEKQITARGIYRIERTGAQKRYIRVM